MTLSLVNGAWAFAAQASTLLTLGLLASWALRRRPARAHAALLAAALACAAAPVLWGGAQRAGVGLWSGRPAATHPGIAGETRHAALAPEPHALGDRALREAPVRVPLDSGPAPAMPGTGGHVATVTSSGQGPISVPVPPLKELAIASWGVLSAFMLLRLLVAAARGRALIGRALPASPELRRRAALLAARLGRWSRLDLRTLPGVATPAIWCWSRPPVLIVPDGWATPEPDRDAVLAHELAHLARRDHLAALLGELLVCALPWNPLAWLAGARLRALAEQACDDWALSAGASPARYAETLLSLVPARRSALTLAAVSRGGSLAARLRRILGGEARLSARAGPAFVVLSLAGALGLASLTAVAQERRARPEQPPGAQTPAPAGPAADYGKQLAALGESGWREAFALGQEIASLPAEQGWQIMRENWVMIPSEEARQQMLKAWVFGGRGPGRQRSQAHVLDVLDLGMRDPSPKVQAWAINYLRPIAFRDFALDIGAYDAWRVQFKDKPPADAAAQSCRAWIAQLKTATTPAEIKEQASFMREVGSAFRDSPEVRDAAIDAGIVGAVEPWIAGAAKGEHDFEEPSARALQLLGELKLDRPTLERIVVPLLAPGVPEHVRSSAASALSETGSAWAVPVLLEALKAATKEADGGTRQGALWSYATALGEIGDPSVIPTLIALIDSDNTYDTVYGIGYFGLGKLTGVRYEASHDGAWWRQWWEKNKSRFPESVRSQAIPEMPRRSPPAKEARTEGEEGASDVAGVPFQDLRAGGDESKRYFLIGPRAGAKAPAKGYGLVLVLPGGDGSPEFRPFVQRILKEALPENCMIAQLVAPRWSDAKDRIVWPTSMLKDPAMKFSTEEFIAAVVKDAGGRVAIDPARVFALGWSSGGPPVYAAAMQKESPLCGAFVAMSVFKPELLPPAAGAAGRRFYVLHSPQDFIKMSFPHAALGTLRGAGAKATLATYEGGHGWHGDVYGNIRAGFEWLESSKED